MYLIENIDAHRNLAYIDIDILRDKNKYFNGSVHQM
jgi:hypothetical protein